MIIMRRSVNVSSDERGFASIVVALTMITVLALITVGFAQLSRREQENALDKQLATQAYYAAETGINDVTRKIKTIPYKPKQCLSATDLGVTDFTIGAKENNVEYRCVMVEVRPKSLVYGDVAHMGARNTTFSTSAVMNTLTVNWGSASGRGAGTFRANPTTTPSTADFTPFSGSSDQWASPAVLQVSITPLASMDRSSLVNNTFTAYLYPSSGGANSVAYSTNIVDKGKVVSGSCNVVRSANYPCQVNITGLAGDAYAIRIINYYDTSSIAITGKNTTTGSDVQFINGQAQVDVTGKAKDVLKRIQVRVPLNEQSDFPLAASNICKRQETRPDYTDYIGVDNIPASPGVDNPCRLDY